MPPTADRHQHRAVSFLKANGFRVQHGALSALTGLSVRVPAHRLQTGRHHENNTGSSESLNTHTPRRHCGHRAHCGDRIGRGSPGGCARTSRARTSRGVLVAYDVGRAKRDSRCTARPATCTYLWTVPRAHIPPWTARSPESDGQPPAEVGGGGTEAGLGTGAPPGDSPRQPRRSGAGTLPSRSHQCLPRGDARPRSPHISDA